MDTFHENPEIQKHIFWGKEGSWGFEIRRRNRDEKQLS
jgi:hypothetical protein